MTRSMTGYGQAESPPEETWKIRVEARSVNHRYLDVAVRMPREIQVLEDKVRRSVQQAVSRGRVEVFITWQEAGRSGLTVTLDRDLVQAYYRALHEICQICALNQPVDLQLLAHFPDVLRVEKEQVDPEAAWNLLLPVLDRALGALVRQREAEGGRLAADISERLLTVENMAKLVKERAPAVVDDYRRRLEERVRHFLGGMELDPSRLLTEAAVFADKSNVTEELVRLTSHLEAFRQALREEGPVGRKLDFLIQELFREVNTIGAKANDYQVACLVVEMKTELEKVREQVQNIE